jgi:uncharacterized membrane protein YdjX (TVP38/TMEM64 family)
MADLKPDKAVVPFKIIVLCFLLAAGVLLQLSGWLDWRDVLQEAKKHAGTWWLASALIALKVVLYAFALPGSVLIWVVGLLYDPLPAILISIGGGAAGATAAYALSRNLSADYTARMETSRSFNFLRRHTDFATLTALRSLPNFPHSVINYGAGIIGVPLPRFILSATIGFTAKGFLYITMIHRAAEVDHPYDALDLKTLGTLVVLSLLFLAGKAIHRHGRAAKPE